MLEEANAFMCLALEEGRLAGQAGDVPVGCVIVQNGKVIARGRNRREVNQDPLAHAELEAIAQASKVLGRWRLEDCQLYVTLEPCPMCTGGIINSRINSVYYGAPEGLTGCCGSVLNLFEEGFGHRPRVYGGVLGEECGILMKEFFQNLRNSENNGKKKADNQKNNNEFTIC